MKNQRIASVDALRGFDMLWIIGAEFIFIALAKITQWPIFNWLSFHMEHADWEGFRFYDNIFPLFLFLAGVSLPFSILKRKEKGESILHIYSHIAKRMLILVLLGCLVNGMLSSDWHGFAAVRYASVLGRIGIAWAFAAVLILHFDYKKLIAIVVGILLIYWAMLMFIAVPNVGAGVMTVEGNFASYIDQQYLPGILYRKVMDPEGLLSTIPAVATALLGALTGFFLKINDAKISRSKKTVYMALAGFVLFGLGYAWSFNFPIIKSIWTSSFVLVVAGLDLVLLSVFYYLVDVKGYTKFAFPFKVIGMNSIAIYICVSGALRFSAIRDFFFKAFVSVLPTDYQLLVNALLLVSIEWLFLYFLYKKDIFLKV